jgi:hypothetical protein
MNRIRAARAPSAKRSPIHSQRASRKEKMSRESVVQILGVVVAAATVLVTVLAVAHLFSI